MGFVNLRKTSIAIGLLGWLVLIQPGSARAGGAPACSCPATDTQGKRGFNKCTRQLVHPS